MSRAVPRIQLLSEDQLDRLHEATLQILENPGMRMTTERARTLLAGAGCRVADEDVSFPRELVEWAISVAPGDFTWYGRDPALGITFGKDLPHWGAGVTCLNYLDPATHEHRAYTLDDIASAARLTDALPQIDFLATPGVVRPTEDLPLEIVNQEEFLRMAQECAKPLMVLIAGEPELRDVLDMAAILRGGEDELRARPFVVPYLNPVSPGLFNPETLDKLFLSVERGAPVVCQPAPQVGATTPMTIAGAVALSNAETLAGLVIAQLLREGAPYLVGVVPMALDMRSGAATAAGPIGPLMHTSALQLARRYGIPMQGDGGSSDAKLFDEQATMEAMYYAIAGGLARLDAMFDGGSLECGLLWSPELLTIVDEMASLSRATLDGYVIDDETLAIDVIREVGIAEIFLGHDHTLAHFREMWLPGLLSWESRTGWEAAGSTTLGERVSARTVELLETHRAARLDDDVVAAMREVIEARRPA